MPSLFFKPLSLPECLHVLRQTHVTRAAFTNGDRPYLIPMTFLMDAEGDTPVICLCMPPTGRKAAYVAACPRVCLEFEDPGCAWVDVVLVEGEARAAGLDENAGVYLRIAAQDISGRRFFLPADGE